MPSSHSQSESELASERYTQRRNRAWTAGFVILPYASYIGLLILAVLFCQALRQRGKQVLRRCSQQGFGWLSVGLLISSSAAAVNKGDAFLQLTNFLPFFVFFGVLSTEPGFLRQPFVKLEKFARALLLTSIPLTLLSIIQYLLRTDVILSYSEHKQLFPDWLMVRIYSGALDRANAFFNNANTLCAYLLILFGLGLGLLLKQLYDADQMAQGTPPNRTQRSLERMSVLLCAGAIFGTGSRTGLVVAFVLVAITLYAARHHRWVLLSGLFSIGALAAAAIVLWEGDRTLSLTMFQADARGPLWQLALSMIRQRPWLGWGLGGLRSQYIPGSINNYEMLSHAHNIWLFLASETGLLVTVGFCIIIGRLCYRSLLAFIKGPHTSAERAIFLGYLMAVASFILYGLFDVVLFDSRNNVLSWSMLAAIQVLSLAPSEERSKGT